MASLGASEADIWHLTKVYWYTVEYGVVREAEGIRAFGAGILSSYGELQYMLEGDPETGRRAELGTLQDGGAGRKAVLVVWQGRGGEG